MNEERDSLHERVLEAIERYGLLDGAGSILVGVSGGQDSVALLHCLVTLDEIAIEVGAIHMHHGMRGATADADATAVESFCEGLGVACFITHRDVPAESAESGLNYEQAGRAARYEEYERAAREHGFERIATGHTGTDRAETLLLNLFRGAGLDGLASIPPRRDRIIRPLILASRDETGAYCRRHGLPIRTDRSNLDPEYAKRNLIRLRLMPMIEDQWCGAEQAIMRACEAVEEELAWSEPLLRGRLDEAIDARESDRLALNAAALAREPDGVLHRELRMAIMEVRGDLSGITREQIERVAEVVRDERSGSVVELPGSLRARKEYDRLILEPDESEEPLPDESAPLPVPGEACLPRRGVRVTAKVAEVPEDLAADDPLTMYVNIESIETGLVLRSNRPGDRFVPLGMTGHRKLQDFFIDEKVPRRERERSPVVARSDGDILWVVGHRMAESARTAAGREAVRLRAEFEARDEEAV